MGYVEAFAKYGAALHAPRSSVSAFGRDGYLVLSLWQNPLKRGTEPGTLAYRDDLSKWKGNAAGRNELRGHLEAAFAAGAPTRLVIAHPATLADAELVGKVADESQINKTFSARQDLVGSVESFDSDQLLIVFRRLTMSVWTCSTACCWHPNSMLYLTLG